MQDPASIVREAYERVRREYGSAIGQRRDELITPALVLDIDAAQRNIDRMAGELRQLDRATIRPHYKTHKSPDLARRQVDAGAGGLSMATVWEAAVLAAVGLDDLFVVNTVAHPAKLRVLAELARDHRILVAVDEAPNAAAHSAAAVAAGSTIGIMIEVDTGMDRCGVDTAPDCLALARQVTELPGLRFEGITGYEGHCSLTIDDELRHERQREAMSFFTGVADLIEADGIGCPIRSAGGIATWNWTAAFPGLTEIQALVQSEADAAAGRYFTAPELEMILAARAKGIDLGDDADVVADMHARGLPDAVCTATLQALVAVHQQQAL